MKCDICNEEIEEIFLGKIKGTLVKLKKGEKIKEYFVCNKCQKEYGDKVKKELEDK